ncbi:MAG TPA: hypothetical protein VHT49_00160 [Acidimicrobiales bacterium]|jgi:hypothetical protein|nr:hypothetical protein [Acidimicrobiales bacterium]
MQFFVTLTLNQTSESPADLQSAMTEFVEHQLQAGGFVMTGGLAPPVDGVRVDLSPGGILQSDAGLPVHGFAVVEAISLAEAVDLASTMLRLHQDYLPDWSGTCEVRPVVTHCLP